MARYGVTIFPIDGSLQPVDLAGAVEEPGFVDVEHQIPIHVAANGPLALRAAGKYGAGRVSAGAELPDRLSGCLEAVREGAAHVGRTLGDTYHTAAPTFSCVLEAGETLDSDRVIDEVGSMVTSSLHFWYELYRKSGSDAFIPSDCAAEREQYLDHVTRMEAPERKRHQQIHDGHGTYLVPAERRFVTSDTIRASGGLVGEPAEIIDALRPAEAAGLREVMLLPPMAGARRIFKDSAQRVIEQY